MSNFPKVERKLAAIMFTDIAGFTASMSYDEQQAMNAVKKKRSIIQPLIKEHNGVFVKEIGDGTLSYFGSAIDASTCAVKLQESTYDEEHLNIRVGLHIGDIVFDGQDVFGEGVNIASRLESLSPVGGVCVSKTVYDELVNKKEFNGTSLGLQSLKGVGRLVEVYALKGDKLKEPDTSKYKETEVQKHTDDEVPSIAIIPYKNKGAEEDVFYAYGISADLISDVTSAGLIRVASMEEIEELGDIPFKEKAKKLNVRYVSNGTLWKMGEMFQLSIELYDTKELKVVWSDRWQEKWENLPNIKSSLSDGLLKALDTMPKQKNKVETTNPDAYEFYLKAKHLYNKRNSKDDTSVSRDMIKKALLLDPNFIDAKILLGFTYSDNNLDKALEKYTEALKLSEKTKDKKSEMNVKLRMGHIYSEKYDSEKSLMLFEESYEIAKELGDEISLAQALNGLGSYYWERRIGDKANFYWKKVFKIYESLDDINKTISALNNIGLVYWIFNKDNDRAIKTFKQCIKLAENLDDNIDKFQSTPMSNLGILYHNKGEYEISLKYNKEVLKYAKERGNLRVEGFIKHFIGTTYSELLEYEIAIEYQQSSYEINQKLDSKRWRNQSLSSLLFCYTSLNDNKNKEKCIQNIENLGEEFETTEVYFWLGISFLKNGDYLSASDCFIKEIEIEKNKKGNENIYLINLTFLGISLYFNGQYEKALNTLDQAIEFDDIENLTSPIETLTFKYLSQKLLNQSYDDEYLVSLINKKPLNNQLLYYEVEEIINLGIYELYGDKKYITSAYERIKKQINNLRSDKIDIFLSYPIPKKITEEYNKVFK